MLATTVSGDFKTN